MDDRSERLRKRRKRSTERAYRAREDDEASKADRSDAPGEDTEPTTAKDSPGGDTTHATEPVGDDGDDGGEEAAPDSTPVKETQTGTYMYLPESQTKELRRRYNVLKAEYEFEFDAEFEKNRHFYPLVIQLGLVELEDMDAEEVRGFLRDSVG